MQDDIQAPQSGEQESPGTSTPPTKKSSKVTPYIATLGVGGTAIAAGIIGLAIAFSFVKIRELAPTTYAGGYNGGSLGCSLTDEAFSDTTTVTDADWVISKMGDSNAATLTQPDNKADLTLLIQKSKDALINPAILISFWVAESGLKDNGKALGCAVYPGVSQSVTEKATKNFASQVDCALPLVKKTMNKTSPYDKANNNTTANMWDRLLYNYVSAAKKTNYDNFKYTTDEKDSRIIILKKLVPDSVKCNIGLSVVNGKNKFDSLSQVIALFGSTQASVQKDLTTTKFMGKTVTVNKIMVDPLKKTEADIKASGINYNFYMVEGYHWRANVKNANQLSAHAFGLAIDINRKENPNSVRPASSKPRDPSACTHDLPDQVVTALKKNGFFWGAEYAHICDAMHFQFGGNWN